MKVNQTHTACKNCVFAQYKGDEQIGCSLNKLEDYRNAGVDVLEVYDETKKFYVIDGRFCLFYRNEQLMQQYPRNTWEDIVKLQAKVPYQVIVFVEKDTKFKDIKETLISLKTQEVPPSRVTIVNKQYKEYTKDRDNYIPPKKIFQALEDSGFHKYEMRNVYEEQLSDRALVDLVFDSSKDSPYPIYSTFRCGFKVPAEFSKELNNAMLIKMLQLGFVKPIDDLNGMIVNRIVHKKYSGNSFGVNLEDKIVKYEDNGENFIFKAEEVCPSLASI